MRRFVWGFILAALVAVSAHAAIYGGARRFLTTGSADPIAFLGDDLKLWWDAHPDTWGGTGSITQSGGAITSWKDNVRALDMTVSASCSTGPVWSATSFGGAPGVTFNGTSDCLTVAIPSGFPSADQPSEMWVLVEQNALVADTNGRTAFSYGADGGNVSRHIARVVVSSNNRPRGVVGCCGGASTLVTGTTTNFSQRHVIRLAVGATQSILTVDNSEQVSAIVTPATTATRMRLGQTAAGSPTANAYWTGDIAVAALVAPLNADKVAQFTSYLMARRGF